MTQDFWTVERVELLRMRWATGHSAGQIALELGSGITRSAVLGKRHRLKLDSPVGTTKMKVARTQRPAVPRTPKFRKAKVVPKSFVSVDPIAEIETAALSVVDLKPVGVKFADLKPSDCRWPTNEDMTDAEFCGHPRMTGRPYCGHHTLRGIERRAPNTKRPPDRFQAIAVGVA